MTDENHGGQVPQPSRNRIGRIGDWTSGPSATSRTAGRFATLGSISDASRSANAGQGNRPGGDHGDVSDEEEEGGRESWFAGGERSGLSIEGPDRSRSAPGRDIVRNLLRSAALAGPPVSTPGDGAEPSQAFIGGGHVLGSDDVPSSYVPDPRAPPLDELQTVARRLTFFRNGFTVQDGPLMSYDDPNDAQILTEIEAGRAPPSVLNIQPGQNVDIHFVQRSHENYVSSDSSVRAFKGQGTRLGAPVPDFTPDNNNTHVPGAFPQVSALSQESTASGPVRERESMNTIFEVDQNLPTTSIQIRLDDGTRLVCRMNHTHTVGDIRNFIRASRPGNPEKVYTIGTKFPNRTLEDDSATIESAGLLNSVIVQQRSDNDN